MLVRQFDERAGWLQWGLANGAEWLHWRCDLSMSAAREKVRVAHALKALPLITSSFSSGELSYSKVRPLTRVARPDNEEALLAFALETTVSRVEERCRELHCGTVDSVGEANRVHACRSLRVHRDVERGMMTITVQACRLSRSNDCVVTAIKRALRARDKCCAFPGCHNTRFVDAHHIQHWSAGGETSLDNLMLLCSRHHRLVHEGGFRIERDFRNRWFFKRPDGRAVPSCGYRVQDMIDDDMREISTLINNPSAERFFTVVENFPSGAPPL